MYKQLILAMIPELLLLAMACLVLLWDAFTRKNLIWVGYAMTVSGILVAGCYNIIFTNDFVGMGLILNKPIAIIKAVLCVLTSIVLIYSKSYMQRQQLFRGEYFILHLFALLGLLLLVSSNNFIVIYLGLELLSIPLYVLIALDKQRSIALEAALKYFIMGALASVVFLYGVSLLYGVTGDISLVASDISIKHVALFKLSLVFIIVGLLFKLGLIPFHMWLPDVYEGSSVSVGAFIATAPKIAIFIVLYRVLMGPYRELVLDWQQIIIVLAVVSIGAGNMAAIVQNNIKRMLAYSTIANVGFAALAMFTHDLSIAIFYMIAYAIMYLGVFGVMLALSRDEVDCDKIACFRGLGKSCPWLAALMLICMFSMVGFPPASGFFAKFLILNALINKGYVVLAGVALSLSVIGVFYCFRLIKVMYFEEIENVCSTVIISKSAVIFLVINGAAVLLLGMISF